MDARFKGCTIHEVLALLEDDEDLNPTAIYIEPPDPAIPTDEDSADEDGGQINNLTGRQLNANCEVVLASREQNRRSFDSGNLEAGPSTLSSPQIRSTSRGRRQARGRRQSRGRSRGLHKSGGRSDRGTRRGRGAEISDNSTKCSSSSDESADEAGPAPKKSKVRRTWTQEDLNHSESVFPEGDYSRFRDKTPVELIELFLDEKFFKLLVEESTKYAAFFNCPNPKIEIDDMVAFIAILINSGYNTVPSKAHYWDQNDDMRNNLIYNSMRRDRFKTIMRFLHCADSTQMNPVDKMWKLRPIIEILKINFKENFVAEQHLNYDESMIEYFGRHGCKQFIRGKPIRFGFKNWCLNTPSGYLVDFEVYQGKSVNENHGYEKDFGKSAAPLVKMIDDLPLFVQAMPIRFYFDNLFTSFQLLGELKRRGYEGTGTVRENRLPKDIPLTQKKPMTKKQRGDYEFTKSKEDETIVVRWKDNSVVTAMSTVHGLNPLTNVTRYSAAEKKKIQVPRPAIFSSYNKFMGGTDLMDQNVNNYRIGIRGKKWWWPIFTYLIDVAVCNAWVMSKKAGSTMSQLNFRRQIVQTYLLKYRTLPKTGGRPAASKMTKTGSRVSDEIRYDGVGHFLVPSKEGSRRKCAYEACKSQTRSECSKCNVGLCLACNLQFHT